MKSTMKYLTVIFFMFLITQSPLIAGGSVSFGEPANNSVYYCERGGHADINVDWGVDELDPNCAHLLFYTKCFVNDQFWVKNGWGTMASGVFLAQLGIGTYTFRVELVQYQSNGSEISPHPTQTITIVVKETPTHGTCTASAAQVGPGVAMDNETSNYISSGSNVSYTMQLRGYANTAGVFASAGLANIVSVSKNITHSDGYFSQTQTGLITNFAGGTITCQAYAQVTAGYSGNSSAVATITW
jgi:hypothetical protein